MYPRLGSSGKTARRRMEQCGRGLRAGRTGVTEYTGMPRSHTVQNVGSGLYHLVLVENLRESGRKNSQPLLAAGMTMTKESRSFRIYETELSSSSGVTHSHEVRRLSSLCRVKRRPATSDWTSREAGHTFLPVINTRSQRRVRRA